VVALEGIAGAMRLVGVEFDREVELRPIDVELVPGLVPAGGGTRQARIDEVCDEAPLELGAAVGGPLVDGERVAEALRAVMAAVAFDHGVDRVEIQQSKVFDLSEHPTQLIAAELPGEIEQRAGDRGHRNPVDHRSVDVHQVPSPVPHHPPWRQVMAGHEGRHLIRLRRAPPDPPKPPGRVIAEQRPRPDRQNGSEASTALRKLRMPDRVHAPMNPMQPPRAHRPFDGLVRELEPLFQLSNRHDSVLSPRKERQPTVARRHVRSSFGPVLAARSSFGPLDGPRIDRAFGGGPKDDRALGHGGGVLVVWSRFGPHDGPKDDRGVGSPRRFVPCGAIWGRTRLRCRRGGGRGHGRSGGPRT
jgi:hypothetical protein